MQEKRTFNSLAEAKAYLAQRRAEAGPGIDLEVEVKVEGFFLEGISADGEVLDEDALRASLEKIKDTHPAHYEEHMTRLGW